MVNAQDGAFAEPDIVLMGADGSQEPGDVTGVQCCGCHLVQQWLENVVGVPVDQRHVDIGVAQPVDGGETTEAAADDHDLWTSAPLRKELSSPGRRHARLRSALVGVGGHGRVPGAVSRVARTAASLRAVDLVAVSSVSEPWLARSRRWTRAAVRSGVASS